MRSSRLHVAERRKPPGLRQCFSVPYRPACAVPLPSEPYRPACAVPLQGTCRWDNTLQRTLFQQSLARPVPTSKIPSELTYRDGPFTFEGGSYRHGPPRQSP